MPITETQKKQRKNHLGSSDMAAVLGLDPFRTAYDVYLEKTAELEEQKETTAMARGNYLEVALLDFAEDNLGPITRNQYRRAEGLPFGTNTDGIVNDSGNPVEAKSQGAFSNEHWGDAGTDDMPHRVIIQSHFHMICTGKDYCHVPAYLPYREFQLFGVEQDKEISDIVIEQGVAFWDNHVLKGVPPEGQPNVAILKRIKRIPETVVEIDYALIEAWNIAKENEKAAKAIAKEAQASILSALGTAEAGKCKEGLFTYFEQHRKGYEVKPCSYRVARFKKGK
jgi:putative phage-type endonuclease